MQTSQTIPRRSKISLVGSLRKVGYGRGFPISLAEERIVVTGLCILEGNVVERNRNLGKRIDGCFLYAILMFEVLQIVPRVFFLFEQFFRYCKQVFIRVILVWLCAFFSESRVSICERCCFENCLS